jgi:hypothetical protein
MVLRKILGAICPILIVPNIRLEILDPVSGMTEIFKNIRFFSTVGLREPQNSTVISDIELLNRVNGCSEIRNFTATGNHSVNL